MTMWLKSGLAIVVAAFALTIETSEAERTLRSQVEETRIPRVQFRDADLEEVVDSLRLLSERHDPAGEGVNIINSVPRDHQVHRITLSLRRISLLDAIRYVTEAAGLTYRIDDRAVIITTRDERPDRIETRMYPVQPSFMDVIKGMDVREEQPRREWWER